MRPRIAGWLAMALAVAGVHAAPAPAQVPSAAVADSGAVYFDRGPLARLHLTPYGDLRWTFDRVRDRPGATSDLSTTRLAVRAGLSFAPPGDVVGLEAGLRASRGGERNAEARLAFRNELPDTVEVDLLGLRAGGSLGTFRVGKMRSPFRLTELLWDDDLRPVGAAWVSPPWTVREIDLRVAAAGFARSRLDLEDGIVSITQIAARLRPEGTSGGETTVSYLAFGDLDELARNGLVRQNRSVAAPPGYVGGVQFVEKFTVVDVQVAGRGEFARTLWTATLDVARNLAAETDSDALRARAGLGGFGLPGGLEVGYVYQRIERDAVVGAYNSDDWWFHSRSCGHQIWVRVGQTPWPELRIAGFDERRDDLATRTRRTLIELRWRVPTR
jgi:hypothetical protein